MTSPRKVLRSSENVSHVPVLRQKEGKIPEPEDGSSLAEQPKAPRSAFMCFTDAKKREIMALHGIVQENDDMLKIVAREWKALSDKDRAHWDEEARNDKVRYVREKAQYKGSWVMPKRRAKKHPLAPKRPMSAFLKYSQTRRQRVKRENPDMSNTDVSRLLGEMWRNATPKEKAPYVEQEERERAVYKENIQKFRDDQARADAASRTSHQSVQSYRHVSPSYDRPHSAPVSNSFDTFHIDTFEEQARPAPFRQQYSSSFPQYPQLYTSDLPAQNHSTDFHEDPLPVISRPPLPPHRMDEEESTSGHLDGSRSYYQEGTGGMGFYSRYP